MVQKIQGEAPFQVNASNFSIGPSNEGYTLQISADGVNYSNLFTVGVGVTRMVTGVANGSFYRLLGNGSEVAINWRQQCNDGGSGGSGSQGPEGPQGPQGATGPQGPAGQDGIDQNPTVLASISALPESAETGDIVALSDGVYQYDGTDWNEVGGGSGVLVVNSLSSSEAANAPVGTLVGQYKGEEPYLEYMPLDTGDAEVTTIIIKGDVDFSSARVQMYLYNGNFYVELGRSGGKWTKINKGNVGGSWTLDGVNIGSSWTGETDGNVLQINDGNNWSITFTKQQNGDWIGTITGGTNPHYKYISSLVGSNAFRYEVTKPMEVNLFMKVSGGTVAHWQGYYYEDQTESFEIIYDDFFDFTTFCDGKIMFTLRYSTTIYYAYMDAANQAIVHYSDSAKTTELARVVYLGGPAKLVTVNANKYVLVEWKEDGVYFYNKQSSTHFENLIDFHTEGVHFSRITDPTKATASDLGLGNNIAYGIPKWNNEGIIVGKNADFQTSSSYVNTTGSSLSNRTNFVYNGQYHFPERIWVPTTGGVQGQMLISDGDNAAPVWSNWIKVVKITSEAYDELATKDPNTLYVIDDE